MHVKKASSLILLFIVLVLGALTGLPYIFGMQAESTYDRMLQQLSNNAGLRMTSKRFERGWLSSTAETVIRYPGLPLEFNALHKISHGPIPLDRVLAGELRLTPIQAQVKSHISVAIPGAAGVPARPLRQLPPLLTDTTITLSGNGRIQVDHPAISKSRHATNGITWGGLSGTIEFDKNWKQVKVDLKAPALSLDSASGMAHLPGSLTLTNMNVRSDMREGVAGYFFGESSISVATLEAGSIFGLRDLNFSTNANPVGNFINMVMHYKVKEVSLANNRYGPGLLTVEARKLDAAILGKFESEIDTLYKKGLPEEQTSLIMLGKSLELITGLSKYAPELEVTKLSFRAGKEEITGNAKFVLDGRRSNVSENPMLLLMALKGHAELRIPRGLLKPLLAPVILRDIAIYQNNGALTVEESAKLTPETMEQIVDQALPLYLSQNEFTRLLVPDANQYKITAAIKRGQFLVNNEPWHVPIKLP